MTAQGTRIPSSEPQKARSCLRYLAQTPSLFNRWERELVRQGYLEGKMRRYPTSPIGKMQEEYRPLVTQLMTAPLVIQLMTAPLVNFYSTLGKIYQDTENYHH